MKKFNRLAIPYLIWMGILVIVPLILMTILAVSNNGQTISLSKLTFGVNHFSTVFSSEYIRALFKSIELASLSTIGCVLLGYPLAYILARSNLKNKYLFLVLLLFPMWICMLLRLKIIQKMLSDNGLLETFFGIHIDIAGTEFAVVLVMIFMYLPFMVFPLFTVLEKLDKSLLEASNDLGANNVKTFLKVTLPLSVKGITSGIIMVFLPAATGFAIPQIIGNGKIMLIGNLIENKIMGSKGGLVEYNVGSLASLIIMILVLGALFIISKTDEEGETLL